MAMRTEPKMEVTMEIESGMKVRTVTKMMTTRLELVARKMLKAKT